MSVGTAGNGTSQQNAQIASGPNQALVVYMDNTDEHFTFDFHLAARLFDAAVLDGSTGADRVATEW